MKGLFIVNFIGSGQYFVEWAFMKKSNFSWNISYVFIRMFIFMMDILRSLCFLHKAGFFMQAHFCMYISAYLLARAMPTKVTPLRPRPQRHCPILEPPKPNSRSMDAKIHWNLAKMNATKTFDQWTHGGGIYFSGCSFYCIFMRESTKMTVFSLQSRVF